MLTVAALSGSAGAGDSPVRGEPVEGIACQADPTQTYTLYLPTAYDPDRRWPVLLVLDPRGRSAVGTEVFREAAEEYGWILLSSNNTRSDTAVDPNIHAVNAMLPELASCYAADPSRIYAAGFSGTVACALAMGRVLNGFAGVIAAGGAYIPELLEGVDFPYFGAVGNTDFNYQAMRKVESVLAEQGTPRRLEIFDGPHSWMPAEMATDAVAWMEVEAMRQGLRPRDDVLLERLFERDMAAADRLERSGSPLDAMLRYSSIVRSFQGLREVAEAEGRVASLSSSAEVKNARREARRWDDFERTFDVATLSAVESLKAAGAPVGGEFAAEVRLEELLRRADRGGIEGTTARRVLNSIYTRTSFYLPRQFLAEHRYAHAAASLSVAAKIRDHPVIWYNLACAEALAGRKKAALDDLERALEKGFDDFELMKTDADLRSLRDTERYLALVEGR